MDSVNHGLEYIAKYRDRFSAWALIIGVLSFTLAVWTTAPSLKVDIPLAAGAKANINIGYVLSLGIPLISIAVAWSYGALATMWAHQRATIRTIHAEPSLTLGGPQRLTIVGPFARRRELGSEGFVRRVAWGCDWIRMTIFFIVPVMAQIWILDAYFEIEMYATDREPQGFAGECEQEGKMWRCGALGFFTAWEMPTDMHPYLPDGKLLEACKAHYEKRTKDCIYEDFPRFLPVLNTIANILFTAITIIMAVAGLISYDGRRISNRLNSVP